MIVQKAIKVRLHVKKCDYELIHKHFGAARWAYNKTIEIRKENYAKGIKGIGFVGITKMFTEFKKTEEYSWLNEINAQSLQAAIKNADTAYQRYFKKISRHPRFKSKRDSAQSLKCLQGTTVDWDNKTIKIRKFKNAFKFSGGSHTGKLLKINSVTISKSASGKFWASIQGDFEIESKASTGDTIGVDLGLKNLLITSNGDEWANERFLRRHLKHLKYLHRQLSRKRKESKSRVRARIKLAREYEKVTNQRKNYLHLVSSQLISDNQVICVEDLSVANMIKNHSLAQAISDVSWGTLTAMLKYKAQWNDRQIVQVSRWFASSQTCSECGWQHKSLTLADREWRCEDCGTTHDRDINAAVNIRNEGMRIMSGLGTKSDTKQKRAEARGSKLGLGISASCS